MFHWIFLTGLNVALNLFHFIRADVAKDGSQVLLVSADAKQDNIKVTDPADIATLQEVFQNNALKRLEPATATLVVTETDNSPLPSDADAPAAAAAEQEVQATLVTDAPLAGTGEAEQLGELQDAPGSVKLPEASVTTKDAPFARQEPAAEKTAAEAAVKEPPTAGKTDADAPTETAAAEATKTAASDEPPAGEQQASEEQASQEDAKTASPAQDEPPAKPAPRKKPASGSPFGS